MPVIVSDTNLQKYLIKQIGMKVKKSSGAEQDASNVNLVGTFIILKINC